MDDVRHRRPASILFRSAEAERAVQDAHRLFQRTLGAWACDMLHLRQTGLLRQTWPPTADRDQGRRAA